MKMNQFDSFTLSVPVVIRRCRRDDLPTLEWFGLFAPQRRIIRAAFESQQRGEALMLVAEANGVASGQAWISLVRRHPDSTGTVWAVRVFPCLQRLGVGTRLVLAAERFLQGRGFERIELNVDTTNTGARRMYRRIGYRVTGLARRGSRSGLPRGAPARVPVDQWVMGKRLAPNSAAGQPPGQEAGRRGIYA
jgi:ribosomal protein S18 acetylase RimI-like enzyme